MTTSKQVSVDNNIKINIRINEQYATLVLPISEFEYETIKQSIKQEVGVRASNQALPLRSVFVVGRGSTGIN
jgi:hypothetical protein